MTSNHHAPYDLGYTRTTMVIKQREATQRCEANPEKSSQFRLQAATRLHEVGIASNRGSACRGEYVPGPCKEGAVEGGIDDWGEVVTR